MQESVCVLHCMWSNQGSLALICNNGHYKLKFTVGRPIEYGVSLVNYPSHVLYLAHHIAGYVIRFVSVITTNL